MMRSKLFVPASRPEFFSKALACDADAISIDLEDSVVEGRKAEARAIVRTFLQSEEARATRKLLIVRVNPTGTPHFEADVAAVVQRGLTMINLPKPESSEEILRAITVLERAESANGVTAAVTVLANIETAKALRCAVEIASAHPRVVGLQLGYGDLFEPLGIARYDRTNVHTAMFAMRLAAGEAGVFAYDGAYANVQDVEGYRAEADMAKHLGFWGKSCIHPSQVALANDAFRPSEVEVAEAVRVLDAARLAESRGEGAFLVEGRMIDVPYVRRAEAIVAIARELKT
jgi:citrate lyase subunit beta / citryl-CoA lyase